MSRLQQVLYRETMGFMATRGGSSLIERRRVLDDLGSIGMPRQFASGPVSLVFYKPIKSARFSRLAALHPQHPLLPAAADAFRPRKKSLCLLFFF